MATAQAERNWTEVGNDVIGVKLDRGVVTRERIANAIKRLDWQDVPEDGTLSLAAMPGMAINTVIREFGFRRVAKVAVGAVSPYGLYGIETHFSNGYARVYVIDTGTSVTPVVSDFWPNEDD